MSVRIIGIGNRLRGDDGIGVRVTEEIAKRRPDLRVNAFSSFGLDVLNAMAGEQHVVVVDGIRSRKLAIGEVAEIRIPPRESPPGNPDGHRMDLRSLLALGQAIGLDMPERITTLGVGIRGPLPFCDHLSGELGPRLGEIATTVIRIGLEENGAEKPCESP